jgi:hypothetical protein
VSGNVQVWVAAEPDGSFAVGLFNLGGATTSMTIPWSDLAISGSAVVRDLWAQMDLVGHSPARSRRAWPLTASRSCGFGRKSPARARPWAQPGAVDEPAAALGVRCCAGLVALEKRGEDVRQSYCTSVSNAGWYGSW